MTPTIQPLTPPQQLPDHPSSGAAYPEAKAGKLLGGVSAVAVVAIFLWLTVNRFLPIVEGWFSYYGLLMNQGKLPYRDFYFFTQPISLLISWAVYGISDKMIYMRYYGFLERLCLTGALYFLMSRRFSAMASFWATVVTMFYFLTYTSEAFFTYLVTAFLFFVVSLVFLQLGATKTDPAKTIHFILAGAAASLSFFSKQSTGAFVTVAAFFLAGALAASWKQSFRQMTAYTVGWLVPFAGAVVWLVHYGLVEPYIKQVFLSAASSKGGFATMLSALFGRAMGPVTAVALAGLCFYLWKLWRKRTGPWQVPAEGPGDSRVRILQIALLASACVLVSFWFPAGPITAYFIKQSFLLITRLLFWVFLAGAGVVTVQLLRKSAWLNDPIVPIVVIGGVAWAYSTGLSFEIEQHSMAPLFCLVLAAGYEALLESARISRRNLTIAGSVLVVLLCWQKYTSTFQWTGWREGISKNAITSHWPLLSGYRTDVRLMGMIDMIMDDVARYSKPGEAVLTFPHIPMFNYVLGRPQPTFCVVHYWDVCPDWAAREDALRVRQVKPRVIVEIHFSEKTWQIHETAFRPGQVSGQRAMQKAILDLTGSGDYRVVRIVRPRYYNGNLDFIWVWVRNK